MVAPVTLIFWTNPLILSQPVSTKHHFNLVACQDRSALARTSQYLSSCIYPAPQRTTRWREASSTF